MEETSSTIPKSDGCNDPGKMFIGGLNWQTTAEGLRQYFTKYGELKECVIMRDPVSKRSRGFGFVTFVEPNSVDMVLENCPHELDGKKIDPKVAVPKRAPVKMVTSTKKIFIGGLSTNTNEEDMRKYFEPFGKVTEVMLMIDRATQRHRGFGFVSFETEKSADDACTNQYHSINNKKVEVKKAQPKEVMYSLQGGRGRARGGLFGRGIFYPLPGIGRAAFPVPGLSPNPFQGYNAYAAYAAAFTAQGRGRGRGRGNYIAGYPAIGNPSYPYAFMNPADQRRGPGGQYYAEYAAIGNSGRGTSRQDQVQQHNTIQDYSQHEYGGGMQTLNGYHHQGQHGYGPPPTSPVSRGFSAATSPGPVGVGQEMNYISAAGGSGANELGFSATSPQQSAFNPSLQF
ncbi:RNA-binding protein Musashi homolog 2 [Exaiptasia diaphana]|uniref:RRM domain-containing protein n=1 Tax=Exaiptasia diaphana TaxID=2652724 RepID=A0A913WUY8_EXADI|nr:RNA-binding protein Musashi homolog 2 [Exaiptasia diaphana]